MPVWFGFRWNRVVGRKPSIGTEIDDPRLSKLLLRRNTLTHAQWDTYDIDELNTFDFVKVGDEYFRPTTIFKPSRSDLVSYFFQLTREYL